MICYDCQMSKPLHIIFRGQRLKVHNKGALYRSMTLQELKALYLAQQLALSQIDNAKDRQLVIKTIQKLNKAIKRRTRKKRKRRR